MAEPIDRSTLESLLAEILRREKNSLEIIEKLFDITTSINDKVVINYLLTDGSISTIELPSLGYLLNEIKRVSKNVDNITGIGVNYAYIRTESGNIRAVLLSEIPSEPVRITDITIPNLFYSRNSGIFEKFVTPCVYTKFDLKNLPVHNTKKVLVKKLLLNINETSDIDFFTLNIQGKNDIDYDLIKADLDNSSVSYSEYDEQVDLPVVEPKLSGAFDVLNIFKTTTTEIVDGVTTPITKMVYRLNKSTYSNLLSGSDINLKKNDALKENLSGRNDTIYVVEQIDLTTNEVILSRREGSSDIRIAAEALAFQPVYENENVILELPVTANQYVVYWFKPVNPNLNIVNSKWGNGLGIFTGNLVNNSDATTNLAIFYEEKVIDIGRKLESLAKERGVALVDGATPTSPLLAVTNFKVELINAHKEEFREDSNIRNLFSQASKLKEDLNKLDSAIQKQKDLIATTTFINNNELLKAEAELTKLQNNRVSTSTQYNSIVTEVANKAKLSQSFDPKYRIRGFWDIPAAIDGQQIIQFRIQYRYLRTDNTASESEAYKYKDAAGNIVRATFSKWNEIVTKVREKSIDANGNPVWADQNLVDPETININQLDIAISAGENVEIRIKSISEAGYPGNPKESDWSASVIIEFPPSLVSDTTNSIATQAEAEKTKSDFVQELDSRGITQHVADSFNVQDKYYAHDGKNISTSFKTPENKPLSVDEVLQMKDREIQELRAIVNSERGQIQVNITDENGNLLAKVSNNDTVNVFSGYYTELIKDAVIKKGEIVSKLYYIEISNIAAADLGLLSYVPGVSTDQAPPSNDTLNFGTIIAGTKYTGYLINQDEYERYRKYWKVPINIKSAVSDADLVTHYNSNTNPFINKPSIQSSQSKGQFAYSRYRDISLNIDLYQEATGAASDMLLPIFTGSDPKTYLWNGTVSGVTANTNGNLTDFAVHVNHPDLASGSDFLTNLALYFNSSFLPNQTVDSNRVYYPFFSHSVLFNLEANETDGIKQLGYYQATKPSPITTPPNFAQVSRKFGFNKNDKYLVGKNTCGSYLFLAPIDHKSVSTESAIYNVAKTIKQGDENKIRIPVIFQFRQTDYDGAGDTGLGIIGGAGTLNKTNLTYTKNIGIDIPIKDQGIFSFDLRCTAIYKPSSVGDLK